MHLGIILSYTKAFIIGLFLFIISTFLYDFILKKIIKNNFLKVLDKYFKRKSVFWRNSPSYGRTGKRNSRGFLKIQS